MAGIRVAARSREQGVVSLLTVMFFMVFISLITIGFMTIVIADQRQTTDNDLSASALAAARSGIEDGKRILMYCQANPSTVGCADAINSTTCDVFDSATADAHTLAANLGVTFDITSGEGLTGGTDAKAYQQYFTCLTIQTKTQYLTAKLDPESADYIQHLKTVSPFDRLRVNWTGATSALAAPGTITGWPRLTAWNTWNGSGNMPVIQIQIIPYTAASFSAPNPLDTIEAGARTIYIAPCDNGCGRVSESIVTIDPRVAAGDMRIGNEPVTHAKCTITGGQYDCSIDLTGFSGGNPGGTQYYVRVSSIYSATSLKLSAFNGGGMSPVNFDNVQPFIDVTGRTNDVFKRVRAEVSYQPTVPLPQNALDSAAPICKDMKVTNDASSTFNCP